MPKWAEAVRRKYLGGEASMFLLHRNVFDRVLYDGKFWALEEFLARVLLWDNKARILTYDPASKVRFVKGGSEKSEELLAALGNEDPLAYLEGQLHGSEPTAVILSYAGSIVPPGDEHFLSQGDRVNVVRLHRWSLSDALAEKDSVVFLLSESLAEVHPKLVSNPRVGAVEIPLPDREARAAVIRHADKNIDDKQLSRLAEHTSGLRAVQIAQFLTPKDSGGLGDAERTALIVSLLGNTADSSARAAKLAGITRGMDVDEIRHLINPDQPLPETAAQDPYAEVLELVHRRKREIIEKECAGLIEFFDSSHGLDAVGGNEAIKAELMQVADAVKSGERTRCPMGMLFVGAMGTGKTFVAKAFVHTSGLSAVTLKNFRSKWVGSTESNLEKVLGMVKALGPIVLVIDEGDRSFGSAGEDGGDDGTSSRVIARLKEFMSDTDNRGVVLFVLMTNRPDKLDIDIKRAGRLDRKIPFFYAQTADEVELILASLFKRHKLGTIDWPTAREKTSAKLVGYSNADLEAVTLLALNLSREQNRAVDADVFAQAMSDYMPTRDLAMIEYMDLQAVFEASRRSMLPVKYQNLSLQDLQARLRELKAELRIR
ncbi:hypothetical protein B1810_23950 [Panacagrimonas perspica]|nr:hypothetical protein B1810_23950 [Panacagrimonas perspica]